MGQPVVVLAEELSPATVDALGPGVEVRRCDGTDRTALLDAVRDASALLIRSATRVDAEVFAAARSLRVVARAGVGLDNVDVAAATQAGVMVVNAPTSNVVSAAELTVGLLLAAARRIAPASAALRSGRWARAEHTGIELFDKTVGVLGLGRIGLLVAQRLLAFGTSVVAYDPYVQPSRAAHAGVRLIELDEVLRTSDAISVHLPRTPQTLGLIGRAELAKVRRGVIVVNAARGGILDEAALAEALSDGRVGAAGLDVFASEPCTDSPLFAFDQVVVTPHLGASTHEAQERAGVAVARSVRLALAGDLVPDAVNVAGGGIGDELRPYVALAETLGRLFTALAGGPAETLTVEVRGEIASFDATVLQLAALKGAFAAVTDRHVSYVNAPVLAAERGVAVDLAVDLDSPDHRNLVTVSGALPDGQAVSVSGTSSGPKDVAKLVEVWGYDVDLRPSKHLAFLRYHDRPGVVGEVGRILGAHAVNIAGMQVSRDVAGGHALIALTVDSPVRPDVLDEIVAAIGACEGRAVTLPDDG